MKQSPTTITATKTRTCMALCIGLLVMPLVSACENGASGSDKKVQQAEQRCKSELQNRAVAGEFGGLENSNEKQAFEDAYWQCVRYYSANG